MKTTTRSRSNHHEYDLYGDLANIKSAILDATRDARGKAGEILTESLENAKEKSVNLRDNAEEYISERPFKAVGIAVLAGLAIGYFLRK